MFTTALLVLQLAALATLAYSLLQQHRARRRTRVFEQQVRDSLHGPRGPRMLARAYVATIAGPEDIDPAAYLAELPPEHVREIAARIIVGARMVMAVTEGDEPPRGPEDLPSWGAA